MKHRSNGCGRVQHADQSECANAQATEPSLYGLAPARANKVWPPYPADVNINNHVNIVIITVIININVARLLCGASKVGGPTPTGGPQPLGPLTRDRAGEWRQRQVPLKHCA